MKIKLPNGIVLSRDEDESYYWVSTETQSDAEEIVIPESHNGIPVTHICECAFYNCPNLSRLTVPGSIVSMGYTSLSENPDGISVTVLDGVSEINEYTFYMDGSL